MKTFIVNGGFDGVRAQLALNKAEQEVRNAEDALEYFQHAVMKAQARLALARTAAAQAEANALIYRVGTRTKEEKPT